MTYIVIVTIISKSPKTDPELLSFTLIVVLNTLSNGKEALHRIALER